MINSAEPTDIEDVSSAAKVEIKIGSLVDRLAKIRHAEQIVVAGLEEQLNETRQLVRPRGLTANTAVPDTRAEPIYDRQQGAVAQLSGMPTQPLDTSRAARLQLPIPFDACGITGFLEAISPAIQGWACSQSHSECLSVALYQDERLVGIARTSESRDDLVMAGHQGAYVFAIPVPETLFDGEFHEIDLRVAGTAQSLFTRPLMVGVDSACQSTLPDIPAGGSDGSTAAWLVFMDSADGPGARLRHETEEATRPPLTTHANGMANAAQLYAREDLELLAQSALVSMEAADTARDSIARTLGEVAACCERLRQVFDEIRDVVCRDGGPIDIERFG